MSFRQENSLYIIICLTDSVFRECNFHALLCSSVMPGQKQTTFVVLVIHFSSNLENIYVVRAYIPVHLQSNFGSHKELESVKITNVICLSYMLLMKTS